MYLGATEKQEKLFRDRMGEAPVPIDPSNKTPILIELCGVLKEEASRIHQLNQEILYKIRRINYSESAKTICDIRAENKKERDDTIIEALNELYISIAEERRVLEQTLIEINDII